MQPETKADSFDFDNFITWLYENRVKVAVGLAVIGAVVVAIALFSWRKTQKEVDANAALFALPSLVGPTAKSPEARPENFQKIASEFPGTQAGERAQLLAAGLSFTDGKYSEAQAQFAKFLDEHGESKLRAQAAMGVAASLEAQGKIGEAITKYQELIAKYSGENVVAPAKLTLARLFETQNKPENALKLYEELMRSNNPYDPWSSEARERSTLLLQKFPKLKTKPPVATTTPSLIAPVSTNQPSTK